MNDVIETPRTEVEVPVAAPVFKGLAFRVNQKISALAETRDLAYKLEDHLDTQTAINKASVALRKSLIDISRDLHELYADVLPIRATLLTTVEDVAKENKKVALAARILEDQKLLASL